MIPTTAQLGYRNPEKGFTMFETAMALVVMAVVGLAAAGGFVYAIRYNAGAADRAGSMSIAQTAIEKFRAVTFADASMTAGVTTVTVTDSVGRTYSVKTTIADKTIVNLKPVIKSITIEVYPVTSNGTLNTSTLDYYGSVKLYTERSTPIMGTNLH
jgi:Tfp pilus assembly protein PilV